MSLDGDLKNIDNKLNSVMTKINKMEIILLGKKVKESKEKKIKKNIKS